VTRDDAVMQDPEDGAADQLVRALRPEARDDRHDAAGEPRLLPLLQRGQARAADGDLADMELRHVRDMERDGCGSTSCPASQRQGYAVRTG
jgi:hypothetical protein